MSKKNRRYGSLIRSQIEILYCLIDEEIKSLPKRSSYTTEKGKEDATRYYMKMRFVRDWLNHKIRTFYD